MGPGGANGAPQAAGERGPRLRAYRRPRKT